MSHTTINTMNHASNEERKKPDQSVHDQIEIVNMALQIAEEAFGSGFGEPHRVLSGLAAIQVIHSERGRQWINHDFPNDGLPEISKVVRQFHKNADYGQVNEVLSSLSLPTQVAKQIHDIVIKFTKPEVLP
jgi:hypothetical protein